MMALDKALEISLAQAKKQGVEHAQARASITDVNELNLTIGGLDLLRTYQKPSLSLKLIKQQKQAQQSQGQFDEASITQLVEQSLLSLEGSAPDPAFSIAAQQAPQENQLPIFPADLELMAERIEEFLAECKAKYPKAIINELSLKHHDCKDWLGNTNGSLLTEEQSFYSLGLMFTSKGEHGVSSFNSVGTYLPHLQHKLTEVAGLGELLRQSGEQTQVKKLPNKFCGDVIVTPHCMSSFFGADPYFGGVLGYLHTSALLTGQSPLQNLLGEKVADPLLTVRSQPRREGCATQSLFTTDGYWTENIPIIRDGVLKNYLLDEYGANKLSLERAKTDGNYIQVAPGETSLQEMIAGVKEGLLFCRYSSSQPASNGDISGVAKNSYYIKDGEVQFPLTETMVSANLIEMLKQVKAVSKESLHLGNDIYPWVKFSGVTVS